MRSASRWIYVAVGCVVLLFSGLVYAWSVLSGPIAAEFPRWTTAQLSLTFTIVMSFFCLGGLTCGAHFPANFPLDIRPAVSGGLPADGEYAVAAYAVCRLRRGLRAGLRLLV